MKTEERLASITKTVNRIDIGVAVLLKHDKAIEELQEKYEARLLCNQRLKKKNAELTAKMERSGIACDKHDLVGGWACPRCLANSEAENADLTAKVERYESLIKKGRLVHLDMIPALIEYWHGDDSITGSGFLSCIKERATELLEEGE